MATYNVNDLVARVRQKADMTSTSFVSDAEIINYLNEAYNKYYNAVVSTYENYYVSTATITTVIGTADYNLPTGTLKPLGFDLNDGTSIITLKPWTITDRSKENYLFSGKPTHYILIGDQVRFVDKPQAVYSITCYYIPESTAMAAAGTKVLMAGADEYVVLDAAVSCLQKEESDTSVLEMKSQQKLLDIISLMAGRNSDLPLKVSDVSSINNGLFPFLWN